MTPSPIGTRIQVISNTNQHHYRVGSIYQVHQVDSDGTFKAIDDLGIEGDYLNWVDCEAVGLGWEWIRQHLDARSLDLLGAFEGLNNIRIRQDVESAVITSIPNLADTILAILPEVEEALAIFKSCHEPDNEEVDFDMLPDA